MRCSYIFFHGDSFPVYLRAEDLENSEEFVDLSVQNLGEWPLLLLLPS